MDIWDISEQTRNNVSAAANVCKLAAYLHEGIAHSNCVRSLSHAADELPGTLLLLYVFPSEYYVLYDQAQKDNLLLHVIVEVQPKNPIAEPQETADEDVWAKSDWQ